MGTHPQALRQRCTGTDGFTLIELMIVIAIIAAIAIPNLLEARKSGNESAAIGSLRAVNTAQALFQQQDSDENGIHDYAASLELLRQHGLLDDPNDDIPDDPNQPLDWGLDPNTSFSYAYEILDTVPPSVPPGPEGSGYRAVAVPRSPATGERVFTIDDTGLILAVRGRLPEPGNEVVDPGSGLPSTCAGCVGPTSIPIPTLEEIAEYPGQVSGAAAVAVGLLDALSDGEGLPVAIDLVENPANVAAILAELDANGDAQLEFYEIVTVDLLTLARALKGSLVGPDPGSSLGPDAELETIAQQYLDELTNLLQLYATGEHGLPSIDPGVAPGNPAAFLLSLTTVQALGTWGWILLALTLAGGVLARRARRAAAR